MKKNVLLNTRKDGSHRHASHMSKIQESRYSMIPRTRGSLRGTTRSCGRSQSRDRCGLGRRWETFWAAGTVLDLGDSFKQRSTDVTIHQTV